MKKFIIAVIMLIPVTVNASSITTSAGVGEYQHKVETLRATIEVRQDVTENIYGIVNVERHSHPKDTQVNDVEMLGIGYRWNSIEMEWVGSAERWQSMITYVAEQDQWEIRSSIIAGNSFKTKAKRTNLKTSVGRQFGPVMIGGYYEVGNVTQKSVSDWYGLYLRYNW